MVTNLILLLLRLVACVSALTVAGTVVAAVITPNVKPAREAPVEPAAVTEPIKVVKPAMKADPDVEPTAFPVDPSITPTSRPIAAHKAHKHHSTPTPKATETKEPEKTEKSTPTPTPTHTKAKPVHHEPKHTPKPKPKPVVHHKPKPKPVVHHSGVIHSVLGAQAYARARVANDYQFQCLLNLWTRESGWRYDAYNPNGGAYGIPQSLPGSKMRSAGADYRTNAATQIRWGLGYIKDVYGTPCSAWGHSERYNWY